MWIAAWLVGCGPGQLFIEDGTPPELPPPPPPLALTLDAPADGAFAGAEPVVVSGRTSHPTDVVTVEGEVVAVAEDGSFSVELPAPAEVRVVTVATARGDETIARRRTVFGGPDPRESWPGAVPVRLTPAGLEQLTVGVEASVQALDLPGLLASLIPPASISGFTFAVREGTSDPAEVALIPQDGALFLGIGLPNFRIVFDASAILLPPVEVVLGMEELRIGAALALGTGADGALTLDVVDTDVELRRPILEFAGIDADLLSFLTGGLLTLVGDVLEVALDAGLIAFDELILPVGEVSTEALGFPLTLSLDALQVDDDGVGALLGVDIGGAPAVATPHLPGVAEGPPGTDVLVALHEGLLGALLSGDVLSALDLGTLELPGFLGEVIAVPLTALPGGGELPADRTGMCVTLGLPTRGVGRVQSGLEPFATLILPDLSLEAAVSTPAASCEPWLTASLALAADLSADGSAIRVGLRVADGAVEDYAAAGEWTETEVVAGLGGLIDAVGVLLGSSLAIDLADLIDPSLLGGALSIDAARRAQDDAGREVPGVVVLSLRVE